MHPKALLDESASLIEKVFKFDHPADAIVARDFRENKSLGPRERATLSDTVFAVLRERLKFEWLARSGSGSKWRRLAILGFPGERDAGWPAEPTPYSPLGIRLEGKPNLGRLPMFTTGEVEVQDEGSQLLALLLGAKRGEMVADFCAGAGGKTLAIGASMKNTGRLYAFDTSAHRLDAIKPRLARSGLSNVHPVAIAHERDERIKRLAGKMDRVLVDAPCSGLGTLRRSPDLKWRQTPETVAAQAELQQRILASAARLLKPGGRLVYATCSLLPQENEAVAKAFGGGHPEFEPLQMTDLLAAAQVGESASLCGPDGQHMRLWPHRHGTDGFFAAAWQKKG